MTITRPSEVRSDALLDSLVELVNAIESETYGGIYAGDVREGLKMKYRLEKADGKPVDPRGVYFVLKLNSDDNAHGYASRQAAMAYADAIEHVLPELASDLRKQCVWIQAGQIDGLFSR